ncbi:MAG: hypothetical protein ACRDA8_02295, partial [Shewanella sp.]
MTVIKSPMAWALAALASFGGAPSAQASSLTNPAISAVLHGYYQSAERPLADAAKGFGLGETEV